MGHWASQVYIPKGHVDKFRRFCTAHHYTNRQTTQRTLSVATGHTYALSAADAA